MDAKVAIPPWERSKVGHPPVKGRVKDVAKAIFDQIISGRYSYGTRLASERDLGDEFGISRATARQVIAFLESFDLVQRRPNSGAFVVYAPQHVGHAVDIRTEEPGSHVLNVSAIAETASPFEMNVICSIIEPEMVRLAALYMSVRDLAELRAILVDIEKIVVDATQFAHLEKKFLMRIAEGTHNRLLTTIYGIVTEVRRQPHWCSTRVQSMSPEKISESQDKLKSLFGALESRDIESAVAFMKLIIAEAQDDLLNSR